MKIFVSHSKDFNFENKLYLPLRNSSLNSKHEIFLPHENDQSVLTKDIIKDSDLILAEVSFPSTGQGIELGWADSFGKRIICFSKEGSKISGSLQRVSKDFLTYKDFQSLVATLENLLR